MDSIRINSGTKKIEVNDEGEYILLPLGDDSFVRGFYNLMHDYEKRAAESELSEKLNKNDILGSLDAMVAFNEQTVEKINELFGADTCRKVFGDIKPGMELIVEFFNSLVPFLEQSANERKKKLSKYNAGRTGSV